MKNILILIIVFLTSCNTSKNACLEITENTFTKTVNCPENGECTIEFIPNKTIEFKKDEFGIIYPIISEGEKTIFKYTYKRNPVANTQDSNYTEIVYAEFDKSISEISLSNSELQNSKFYFGRICYCKGETGYYAIKNGEFEISELAKNSLKVDFEFSIKEVPQIISKISEMVSLKSNASN
jgi:hypothetical protein